MKEVVLEVKNLWKKYETKQGAFWANQNIDFKMYQGEILALLGPNGAGKSTLVKQIIGYVHQDQGEIFIDGKPVNENQDETLSKIGYMMQSRFAHWDHLSVYDAIYYSARLKGLTKKEAKLEIEELTCDLELTKELKKPIRNLSGGKKQAAALACSVIGHPPIIILDEPTTGLDPEKRVVFWNFLKKQQREFQTSILLITHNVAEVEQFVDRVLIVANGTIMREGTCESLYREVGGKVRIEITCKEEIEDVKRLEEELKGYEIQLHKNIIYVYEDDSKIVNFVDTIFHNKYIRNNMENFKVNRPTLEDVYIKIMGEKIS